MTAREPNQSPISAAGGGRPWRAAPEATARSTAGALPESAIRSTRIDQACQNAQRLIALATLIPPSLSGLRIA